MANKLHKTAKRRCDNKIANSPYRSEIEGDYLDWNPVRDVADRWRGVFPSGLSPSAVQQHMEREGIRDKRLRDKRKILEAVVEKGLATMRLLGHKVDTRDMVNATKILASMDGELQSHNTNIQINNAPEQSEFDERLKTTNRLRGNIVVGREDE